MKRPHVVCHIVATVDGRIQTERWNLTPAAEKQYEAVHALHKADAWMCGRQTFQGDFLEQSRPAVFSRRVRVPPGDFIAPGPAKTVYAIAVDSEGRLRWESSNMRGDTLVVITTGKAPSGYLADLRSKSISYLIGGSSRINLASALGRLRRHFRIRKVMLEGGGSLNGAFLAAGLIDELSLLVCPFADGSREVPTLFDSPAGGLKRKAAALTLLSARPRPGGVLWLRYAVR